MHAKTLRFCVLMSRTPNAWRIRDMVRVLYDIDGASPTQCLEHSQSLLRPDTKLRSRDRDPKKRADKERSSSRQPSVRTVETPVAVSI